MSTIKNKFAAKLGSCSFAGDLDCLSAESSAKQSKKNLDVRIQELKADLENATDPKSIANIKKVLSSLEFIQRVQKGR
jgi:hypothetical protein